MRKKPQKPKRLERLVRVLMLGAALHFGAGCGALPQTSFRDEIIRKRGDIVTSKDLEGRLSKANRSLMNFPTSKQINLRVGKDIIRSVDKYMTPGARYLLVHVRQLHFVKDISKEEKRRVMRVQNDIYSFLDYLRKDPDVRLRRVYAEGYVKRFGIKCTMRLNRALNNMYRDAINDLRKKIKMFGDNQSVKGKIKSLEQQVRELILCGATIKLGAEGKLEILPAEKSKVLNRGDLRKKEVFYAIVDNRENGFLEIVSRQSNPFVLVVYGGAHAWGGKTSCGADYNLRSRLSVEDNIAKHNAKHPNKAFSLIEVTVDSYREGNYKWLMEDLK